MAAGKRSARKSAPKKAPRTRAAKRAPVPEPPAGDRRPPAKNIVICCDGTANGLTASAMSNVLELYRRLERDPGRQVTYYDSGVGTLPAPNVASHLGRAFTRLLGLAFGYGMARNLAQAYRFLIQHYQPGDRVFLFGFSRGAYTVRALAGMVRMCGLLPPDADNLIEYALRVHRLRGDTRWKIAARFRKYFARVRPSPTNRLIHFVGVWDTVKSVGLWDVLRSVPLLGRPFVLPYTANMQGVAHGRHAVSISEKRSKYRPNLWDPPHAAEPSEFGRPRFVELWFPGVHSDVGGGYEEQGLSDVSLQWMLEEAHAHGLHLHDKDVRALTPDPNGPVHNPLWPFFWVLGWAERRAPAGAQAHPSVQRRRQANPAFDRQCRRVFGAADAAS